MNASRLDHGLDAIGWLKEFAGLRPEGYSFPAVTNKVRPNSLASYVNPSIIQGDLRAKAEEIKRPLSDVVSANAADYGSSGARLWNGGLLRLPTKAGIDRARSSSAPSPLKDYPDSSVARRALRRHEAVHSILQQRRGGVSDSIAGYAKEEATAYRKQLFGPKSPAREMPLGLRVRKLLAGTYESTKKGIKTHGITKWFDRKGLQASLDLARNRTDRNPTEGQKKAGNYRKGSLSFQGIPVTLENPRGSVRRGVDENGKPWSNEMHADYGYIPRTKGKDGDQVDVFLGPSHRSQLVVAIDQHKGDGFDETKFILGCDTREQAEKLYLSHYPKDWKLGPVSTCTIDQFKEWLSLSHPGRMGHMKQPFRGQELKALTAALKGMKQFEKPFSGYNPQRHARTGGLNDSFREKYNRENGSHLQRPVTKKPSELKPGSKAAKRRESFCARMSGVSGPTSKDGKLTPKGAALKRWNCSALVRGIKHFSQTPEEERHELLKTGLLSTGLATGLALGGVGLRGTVGAAEKVAIKRGVANKIAAARRNARMAGEVRSADQAKTAKDAAKERYRAGNASFQNLARNPNLTKGEKQTVRRVHGIWKEANPGKEFSADRRERSGSQKLRDGAVGAGALAAGGGILHAGLKVGRAADEVTPTAKAIRALLAHGEQAAGNFRKGWLGRLVRLSARPLLTKRFSLRTEEDGIPYTGRVNRDRFVKQINESDLDRRDRNMDRAATAGAAAGWLTHGKGSTLKQRLIRTGLGAGAGVGGVLAIRAVTDKKRDIYGDRPRWAKRAEVLPTVAGVGVAGALLAKKAKLFGRGDYVRKIPGARPSSSAIPGYHYDAVIRKDVEGYATTAGLPIGSAHRKVPVFRKIIAKHARDLKPAYDASRKDAVTGFLKKSSSPVKTSPRSVLPVAAIIAAGTAGGYLAGKSQSKEKKEFSLAPDRRETASHQAIKAGISGAASGALLGGGTALLTRGKSIKSALRAAGIGAGAMGALAGGGTAIGNKVLGNADPNDKAAFTKRAAVGGALAGAAIGGIGAVALKRGILGAKIAEGFAKGAKTWRPLHAIEQSSAPVAAAVGAGAGALYGAHQGADEGMMVDAINNSRIADAAQPDKSKKSLGARIKGALKEFGYSSQLREKDSQRYVSPTRAAMGLTDYDGSLGTYQVAKGFYNKGKAAHRWGGRGANLLRDTGDVLAGRGRRTDQAGRPQKREWEKAWFHRTVGSAAAGGALLGGALLTSKTRFGQQHILPQIKKADAAAQKYGVSLFSIKLNRLKQFDLDAALAGWDVRDPRGKSARVFAPGSRPRFRRPKEWHEKKENREALLKGAILGTGLLGIAGGAVAARKLSGLTVFPKKAVPAPVSNIIKFPKKIA